MTVRNSDSQVLGQSGTVSDCQSGTVTVRYWVSQALRQSGTVLVRTGSVRYGVSQVLGPSDTGSVRYCVSQILCQLVC